MRGALAQPRDSHLTSLLMPDRGPRGAHALCRRYMPRGVPPGNKAVRSPSIWEAWGHVLGTARYLPPPRFPTCTHLFTGAAPACPPSGGLAASTDLGVWLSPSSPAGGQAPPSRTLLPPSWRARTVPQDGPSGQLLPRVTCERHSGENHRQAERPAVPLGSRPSGPQFCAVSAMALCWWGMRWLL